MKIMWLENIYIFLKQEIWRIRGRELPRHHYFFLRLFRIFLLASRDFVRDKCQLRASALTFYSLFSVVPVMAMAFGIAKGFGFKKNLETLLTNKLQGQEEVLQWIMQFANAVLEDTKGGVVAGVGVFILFLAVIKLLEHIEKAFNDIWYVKKERSFTRKLSNYLSVMLICPLLLIVSSSLTVFITSQMAVISEKITLLGTISPMIFFLLKLSPYFVLWVLFSFVYIVLPNTGVSFRGGLLAGLITGTIFQVVQKAYIHFQIGVAQYNAIYGSFAALPLFLIWLQLSWIVVLYGAEISFAVDNEESYESEPDYLNVSPRFKKLLALRIVELCVKRFSKGEKPLEALNIANESGAPIRLVREVIFELVNAQILSEIKQNDNPKAYYQPAQSVENLTLKKVMDALDMQGDGKLFVIRDKELKKIAGRLESFDRLIEASPENIPLKDL
ncbi:MAG: YihY/virulence factor BrkB family protein [Pseudomonadota bacterium]